MFKFALIKLGLVLSVVQPMIFTALVNWGVIGDEGIYSANVRAELISNWVLLLEMPFFAYLAWRAFPVEDYLHGYVVPLSATEEGRGSNASDAAAAEEKGLPEHRRSLIDNEEKPPVGVDAMEMSARPSVSNV